MYSKAAPSGCLAMSLAPFGAGPAPRRPRRPPTQGRQAQGRGWPPGSSPSGRGRRQCCRPAAGTARPGPVPRPGSQTSPPVPAPAPHTTEQQRRDQETNTRARTSLMLGMPGTTAPPLPLCSPLNGQAREPVGGPAGKYTARGTSSMNLCTKSALVLGDYAVTTRTLFPGLERSSSGT
jgi:hypothetical protein